MNSMMLLEEVEQVAESSGSMTTDPLVVLSLFAIGTILAAGFAVSLGLLAHRE